MAPTAAAVVHLAAESRDSHITLRRVERQQRLVEILGATTEPMPSPLLARQLGVGLRSNSAMRALVEAMAAGAGE